MKRFRENRADQAFDLGEHCCEFGVHLGVDRFHDFRLRKADKT